MRAEIAALQRELAVTTVYVTHDQVEAMTMGDRVAVLKDGYLQQVDTPQNLYDRPDNVFVGAFIGSPSMNLYEGRGRLSPAMAGSVTFGSHTIGLGRARARRAARASRPTTASRSSSASARKISKMLRWLTAHLRIVASRPKCR